MKRILVFCAPILAIIACNKDKVESQPHLKFKSFSSDVIGVNGILRATLEFTDQEGDLDSVFITRQRLNKSRPDYYTYPVTGSIPDFGNQNKGELQLNLDIPFDVIVNLSAIRIPGSNPERFEPDTLLMRFYIKDKAGNVSDTTSAKPLFVIR
jgi:hypothetical protein